MQEPSGEGIACARGVDHLWRGQRRLDTAFTANTPAHRGGPIRHHHIRPLGQFRGDHTGIIPSKKPQSFFPGQLDQGRLLQQGTNRRLCCLRGSGNGIRGVIPKRGTTIHIQRLGDAL